MWNDVSRRRALAPGVAGEKGMELETSTMTLGPIATATPTATAPNGVRDVARVVRAHRQTEGAGFIVRRPFPSVGLPLVDPFLLLDEMGPIDYAPGEATGAPDHPHRGFETISYVLEGELEHEDSAGHRGALGAGDVQWMTAGAGVVHSEMPSRRMQTEGGRVHGFQVWVNLPARLKMTKPRYQEVPAASIPEARTADGLARGRIIAGEALGVRAVIETHAQVVYQDWSLAPGADVTLASLPEHAAMAYVFAGAARIGGAGKEGKLVQDGELAILGPGDAIRLAGADVPSRVLLLAGVPIGEPVARYGPFVMNTAREIEQAFRDYQSGRMGQIARD